jgi:hypothetical protein
MPRPPLHPPRHSDRASGRDDSRFAGRSSRAACRKPLRAWTKHTTPDAMNDRPSMRKSLLSRKSPPKAKLIMAAITLSCAPDRRRDAFSADVSMPRILPPPLPSESRPSRRIPGR